MPASATACRPISAASPISTLSTRCSCGANAAPSASTVRIKLHGNQYPVTSVPYGTVVEVRFDPYDLAQLAIYDASGVLIETTSAAKQVTAQVPNIPAESAAKPAQVSAAARAWFTRLREQHHAALRDRNQTSFTRFQSTDDDDKELRDADA